MPALVYHLKAWRVELLFSLYGAEMRETWRSPNSWAIIAVWVDTLIEDFYCPMSWPLLDSYLYFIFYHDYILKDWGWKVKLYFGISERISKSWACTLWVSFAISFCKCCTWTARIERVDSLRERLSLSCHQARSFWSFSNFWGFWT